MGKEIDEDTYGPDNSQDDKKKIPPPPKKSDGDGGAGGARFTQEDADSIASRARKSGQQAAKKALLEELGVEDMETAKAVVDAQRKRDKEDMSEAEAAKAEADEAKAKADAERSAARSERLASKLQRALMAEPDGEDDHPILVSRVDHAVTFELGNVLDADDEDDAITEAVETLRDEFPEWFVSPSGSDDNTPTGSPGLPARKRTKFKPGGDDDSPKARAAKKFERLKKSRTIPMGESA